MKSGKVWLVGAGPSDSGLFTLKGKDVLEKADVVVYDKLVGQGILNFIPKDCRKIYVGKEAGNHPVPQDKINKIILDEAIRGNKVVRLKGGDPFLFGRGGEELELLIENNIKFEIVPGITSAISVPAYAGIPVTHRDFTSSLHIITGHTKKDSSPDIDFKSLVKLNGTLVFLMGVSSLDIICSSLIKEGMDKSMPAAIIQSGTTSKQKTVLSTIEKLSIEAKEKNIKTPGLIIIGKVASLHSKFSWIENLSLAGLKVMVTRPKDQASRLSKKLYEKGAEVVEIPTIETKSLKDNKKLLSAIENIKDYKWIALTSPTGAKVFFDFLVENSIDIRKFSNVKFASVGSTTTSIMKEKGIIADFTPSKYDGETLAKEILPKIDGKVLIPRAEQGSSGILDVFNENNIDYDDIGTYETSIISQEIDNIEDFDYIAFTSASTVKGFVNSVKNIDYTKVNAVCIGHQTESEAKKYNMNTFVSNEATLDSMVLLLESLKEGNQSGFNK